MGDCQNYGPFFGSPNLGPVLGKRDHNFDNPGIVWGLYTGFCLFAHLSPFKGMG